MSFCTAVAEVLTRSRDTSERRCSEGERADSVPSPLRKCSIDGMLPSRVVTEHCFLGQMVLRNVDQ